MARKQVMDGNVATMERIDEAVDLLAGVDPEAEKAAYRQRLSEELAKEDKPLAQAPRRAMGLWTVDAMRHKEPAVADLYDNGEHLWHFMPLMQDTYCQMRYRKVEDIKGKYGSLIDTQIMYAEIVWYCMDDPRCDWDLQEPDLDAEGNLIWETDPETGEACEEPKHHPLPRKWESVLFFDWNMLVDILNAFQRSITGEANGQR